MAAIQHILAQVFKSDHYEAWKFDCNPLVKQPVPADLQVDGEEYFEPEFKMGVVFAYNRLFQEDQPGPNAFLTTRLFDRSTGKTVWILGSALDWAEKANACCGNLPEMDTVTIPTPEAYDTPCGEIVCVGDTPEYKFTAAHYDDILAGQKITLEAIDKDGVAFTPALSAGGYTSIANLLAAAQANWGAYGTWSAEGTKGIKLVSEGVTKARIRIKLIDQSYCLTVTAAQQFNAVKNGDKIFPLGKTVTVVDAAQVINEIKDYFQDGALTAFSGTKINYAGTNVPGGLYNGSTLVVAFAANACS